MAQLWYSPISINSGQVPSTQTDFPVLVSVTDARFKDVAHSGHVNRSDGFDLRPYTDTTLGTAITGYELERYVPTTGEILMWVKVSSLSSSTTPIVLGYGDTGITTDGSSTTTWSNSFTAVWHLKDGTTLSLVDALGTYTLTNNNTATAATGKIDGGVGLASASSQYLTNTSVPQASTLSLSAWIKGTSFPNDFNGVITSGSGSVDYSGMFVQSNGKIYMTVRNVGGGNSTIGTGTSTLSTGTFYHMFCTYDNSHSVTGMNGYINGSLDGTISTSGAANTTLQTTAIGRQQSTATRYFNGIIDEVRVASVERSANWITTEYNNQNAPGTFETLGSEVAVGGASTSNFFLLFP